MPQTASPPAQDNTVYPESDGKPMAENSLQLEWIIKLVGNLKNLFRDRPDVFAAGNQNWYPIQYDIDVVQAPDAYVVFGRPKGHRPSYKQWEEGGVPMTVVIEVLSPGNTYQEMADKLAFYDDHGVEEYYIYDPDRNRLEAFVRRGTALPRVLGDLDGFVSPRLGIRFDLASGPELIVRYPDGRPFLTIEDLDRQRRAALDGLLEGLEALLEAKFQQQGLALMGELRKVQDASRLAEIVRAVRKAATVADVPTS